MKKVLVVFRREIGFVILVTGSIRGLGFLPFILQQLFENKEVSSANPQFNRIVLCQISTMYKPVTTEGQGVFP